MPSEVWNGVLTLRMAKWQSFGLRYPQSPMANSISSDPLNTSLLAVTQTAVGCGIGLLIAGKLERPTQKTTAATLLSLGVLLAMPAIVATVSRVLQETDRGVRRRLDSIREDAGMPDPDMTDAY